MKKTERQQKHLLPKVIHKTAVNVIDHQVSKSAAALTYYLLFAMFPLLIFISNLLGLLDLDVRSITTALLPVLPDDIVYLMQAYLEHITQNSSPVLLGFSVFFTVWFPMRAVGGLMDDVRLAYQLGKPEKPIQYAIRQFLFTILFLVLIIVLLLLAILGRRFISTVMDWLELDKLFTIPPVLLSLWQYLRFVLLAAIIFAIVGLLYATAQDHRQRARAIMPGVFLTLVSWLLVSIGFSAYVENFANYSLIYGALGTVIVLLVWLYLTSFMLILGAEFNASIYSIRKELPDRD